MANKALHRKFGSGKRRALNVYLAKADVKKQEAFGGKPYYQFKAPDWINQKTGEVVPGFGNETLKGDPLSKKDLEGQTLFHATTDVQGVRDTGALLAGTSGIGLGGGRLKTVSFTDDPKAALWIARDLDALKHLAQGKHIESLFKAMVRRDLTGILPEQKLRDEAAYLIKTFRWRLRNEQQHLESTKNKSLADQKAEAAFDVHREYLMRRDRAGGPRNPIMFTSVESARKMKDIGVVAINARDLPDDAHVGGGADKFQGEIEVHGDVSVEQGGGHVLSLSEIRKKAWKTRRKLYGPSGRHHNIQHVMAA